MEGWPLMQLNGLNLASMWEKGVAASREDRKQSALRDFLQPARQGDQNALGSLYKAGAVEEATQAEAYAGAQQKATQDALKDQLAQTSKLMLQGGDPMAAQLYPQWREMVLKAIPNLQLPEAYEPGAMQAVRAFAGEKDEQYTLTPGSKRFGADGRLIAEVPMEAKAPDTITDDDGNVWAKTPQGLVPYGPAMPAPTTGGGAGVLGASFEDAIGPLLKREGGFVRDDAGAGPTNFGINSRANPDINVASLTPQSATQIYRNRYWNAIGADNLPPQIRQAAFDTAVNMGPEVAKRLAQESGGDPERFMALRQQRYDGLVRSNPQKYGQYAQAWAQRNRETAGPTFGKKSEQKDAPSGYQWGPDGQSLVPIPGGPADRKNNPMPADMAKDERQMRQELSTQLKGQREVVQAFEKVRSAAQNPSPMSDIALIYSYMKMLDPGSVVREGEFATAQNAAGIPDQLRNRLNQWLKGGRLNPQQRQQIVAEARKVHDVAASQIANKEMEYGELAEQYGYDARRATGSRLATAEGRQRFQQAGELLQQARDAVRRGADRKAVQQRLREQGFANIAERL